MNKILKLCSGFALILLLLTLCTACSEQPEEGSVVARVNGQPISMRELQARYDLDHLTWTDEVLPQAEDLQVQYGDSLANLIINALVMQELDKKKMSVTAEEMNIAELEVKSDYGEEEFEQTLEEEAIDFEMWRLFLLQRLSVQKFMQTVLRPDIRVSLEESTKYYNDNLDKFSLPARVHFLVVDSNDKAMLARTLASYNKEPKTEMLVKEKGVRLREVRMREDRISPELGQELAKLKAGQASPLRPEQEGWQFLILVGRQPKTVLTQAQAYALVEKELVEQKLEMAFDLWVNKKIKSAEIEIAPPLVEAWVKQTNQANQINRASNMSGDGHNATAPYDYLTEEIDPDEEARLFEQESAP